MEALLVDVLAQHRRRNPTKKSRPTAEYLEKFSHRTRTRQQGVTRGRQKSGATSSTSRPRTLSRSPSIELVDQDEKKPKKPSSYKEIRQTDFDAVQNEFLGHMADSLSLQLFVENPFPDLNTSEAYLNTAETYAAKTLGTTMETLKLDRVRARMFVRSSLTFGSLFILIPTALL